MLFWLTFCTFVVGTITVPTFIMYDIQKRVNNVLVLVISFVLLLVWSIVTPLFVLYHLHIIVL